MPKLALTAKQIAVANGLDPASLSGFLRTCVELGFVEDAGKTKQVGTKGPASKLYAIPDAMKIQVDPDGKFGLDILST